MFELGMSVDKSISTRYNLLDESKFTTGFKGEFIFLKRAKF